MSQFFESGDQSIGVSASTSVFPMEYTGLISFRMDWLDLLAVLFLTSQFFYKSKHILKIKSLI